MYMDKPFAFAPVQKVKASQLVEQAIKRAIIGGTLNIGDKLPSEIELSEQFQVNRSTVREAIRSLTKLGIIHVKKGPGQGSFVVENLPRTLSEKFEFFMELKKITLDQVLEFRIVIETSTAEFAAQRRVEEDLQNLKRILAVDRDQKMEIRSLVGASLSFHLGIAAAAKSPLLYLILESIAELLRRCIVQTVSSREEPSESIQEHCAIYNAVFEGNSLKAKNLMLLHLQSYRQRLKELGINLLWEGPASDSGLPERFKQVSL
jgi:GntR family transcriptional repressor for pyruvate dehydrogenase complex